MISLRLSVLEGTYAICRLDKGAHIPDWAFTGDLFSITRTVDELSVVCRQDSIPVDIRSSRGWKCIKVEGPLDLSMTGVLASLAVPLTGAGISIFALSTYDTDYLMVKEADLENVIVTLDGEGHSIKH